MQRLLLLFALLPVVALLASSDVGFFWHLTDPHLDLKYLPNAEPNCPHIICCHNDSVAAGAFQGQLSGTFGSWGKCDIPPITFASALDFLTNYNVTPDFVVFGGDNLSHEDWIYTQDLILQYTTLCRDMMVKAFSASEKFKNTRLFYTIGNHDTYPIDQFDTAPGKSAWFLNPVTDMFGQWMQEDAQTYRNFGYATVLIRKGVRVVLLNTQYQDPINFYLYRNITDKDPGHQLAWLSGVLGRAEANNEKVFIFGHIPPGMTFSNNAIPKAESMFTYNDRLQFLVTRYNKTIVFQGYGHTHKDAFRMILDYETNTKPVGVSFVAPAVTNWGDQNPSIRLFSYNTTTGQLIDIQTFYGDLDEANQSGTMTWKLEYSARDAYQMADMSPESWYKVFQQLDTNEDVWQKFGKFYYSLHGTKCPNPKDKKCRTGTLCGIEHINLQAYEKCRASRG